MILIILVSVWLLLSTLSFSITTVQTQLNTSSISNARALNSLLQAYAYQAFHHPRTGVIYDAAVVPSNLTGIRVSAMRLRSGSLRRKGFGMYKEFDIPKRIVAHPYVVRLVLVYHNLANWSTTYYPLDGYAYLAPVVGLLAYDASNLTARNLPELDIRASDQPIYIKFREVKTVPYGTVPKCVAFDTNGSINLSDVSSENTCTTFQQGHFSIVVESLAPFSPPPSNATKPASGNSKKGNSKAWKIVGSVVGGFILLIMLGLLVVWVANHKYRKKKMDSMEKAAESGEALSMTNVGSTKAPVATVTRTQPTLETEYRP